MQHLNYAPALKEDITVHFVDVRIMDIVEDMTSLNLLAANSSVTYRRYIRVGKTMIKRQGVLPLLVKLAENAPLENTIGITYSDVSSIYVSSQEDIFLMNPAGDAFFENDHKTAAFHPYSFYRHTSALF